VQRFLLKIKFLCIIYNRKRRNLSIYDLYGQLIKKSSLSLISCLFPWCINCTLVFIKWLNRKWQEDIRYYTIHVKKTHVFRAYMCVCMYICMYVYIYIHIYIYTHIHKHILCVCVCARVRVYVCICIHLFFFVYIWLQHWSGRISFLS